MLVLVRGFSIGPITLATVGVDFPHACPFGGPLSKKWSRQISAYLQHWSAYLQGTCIPLPQARVLVAGHPHTPDTGQNTTED